MTDELSDRLDELAARDDTWVTREVLQRYVDQGAWTEQSFVHDLERHAAERPDSLAIIDEDGRRTSYGEYEQRTRRLASSLLGLGLRPGDRLAMQLPNSSEFCLTLMACARVRIIPVFLHVVYDEHDLDYVLNLTEARALVVPASFNGRDFVPLARTMCERIAVLEHIVVVGGDGGDGLLSFEDMAAAQPAQDIEALRPTGADPFFIMFTSGTTGRPKAELHTHANNLFWIQSFEQGQQFPRDAQWIIVTPIAHLTGLGLGVLSALRRGAAFTLLTGWDVGRCVELLERDKPTYLLGAAPMLIDLARFPDLGSREVRSLRGICYAGAPCPAETLNALNAQLGAEIAAFYGYTEAGVTFMTRPGDPISVTSRSIGSVLDGVEMRLVDDEGDDVEPPGEGELWSRGPNFVVGYYGQPETTARMFDADGWFRSADIVRIDTDGYGYFVSRRDDLINRGGYKIDPREIEELLYTHPRVGQAAVVAMPDERLGQRAAVFVVPATPGDEVALADLTTFLEEKGLSRTKWPEAVELVESFPMTSTGKFMRYSLRERAEQLRPQR
ncbi:MULTISPECIES: class I adenylate-forming enzyme family protein [Pseudonocardia]|uniref:Acyl--CoA ligase n=1 Tax=Pseudonocardia abyssalis TaxID=2792008 RepID=A0ABS6V1I1_9PSEU|nr:class I adenylate-forming enzyme family protein [Pseudonocardia abyssalis]MBW0113698.1 acyl--CoA ligase [Pseudonocardia abyssalis]MBW0138379.1 acyl--CoA ligase [Pseudonocardia abyssalis]